MLSSIGYAGFAGLGLAASVLGIAWPFIRASFDLPLDAVGAVLLTFTVGYLASSVVCGRLLARLDLGAWLALGAGSLAISLLASGLAPAWAVLVGVSALAGLGGGAIDAGLNVYGATRWSPRRLNGLHACFGLGAMLSPPLVTGLLERGLSWRWGYAAIGLVEACVALAFLLTRPRWRLPHPTTGGRGAGASLWRTLRQPLAWLAIGLFFAYTGIEAALGQWAFSLLTQSRGLPDLLAGLGVSLYWGSLTAGRLLFGLVPLGGGRIDPLTRACLVAVAVGAGLLWLDVGPLVGMLGLALTGVALAPVFPWLVAGTPERVGLTHAANVISLEIGAAVLGGAVLASGIGVLAARAGLEALGPALLATTLVMLSLHLAWARPSG